MERDDEELLYLGAGPLVAILLGVALVPMRGFTTASNYTFLFMALTILVAGLGGRAAAVATALCSALSLDFFLTRPYLSLRIEGKHDLIAFAGLAICGLVSAALGAAGARRAAALDRAEARLALMRTAIGALDAPGTAIDQVFGKLSTEQLEEL